ncbi:hypothetical protein E2C01_084226 [Portunus trituberculatus]|uniref:Uncharacterized protein n=1 Tax=Portunus trituberculatus TaxID=210409 RepID=A0A5B7J8N5_PORTR|nr:hypothetical protein [Portunus trituberculatus]
MNSTLNGDEESSGCCSSSSSSSLLLLLRIRDRLSTLNITVRLRFKTSSCKTKHLLPCHDDDDNNHDDDDNNHDNGNIERQLLLLRWQLRRLKI